jgi:hypothetical protein
MVRCPGWYDLQFAVLSVDKCSKKENSHVKVREVAHRTVVLTTVPSCLYWPIRTRDLFPEIHQPIRTQNYQNICQRPTEQPTCWVLDPQPTLIKLLYQLFKWKPVGTIRTTWFWMIVIIVRHYDNPLVLTQQLENLCVCSSLLLCVLYPSSQV